MMNSNLILLEPELAEQVAQITSGAETSTKELVNQAVREHLERLNEAKFEAEAKAYEKLHPQLVRDHSGQFVAIHEGQLIDYDADFETLFLRVKKRIKNAPVFIQLVTESIQITLHAPKPRLEWGTIE